MESLCEFFRLQLHQEFPSNLDALEEILMHTPDITIEFEDIAYFRTVFDRKMTKIYFWDRYDEDVDILSDTLIQVFSPYLR